jgi:ubiquinone/menaquinone biosynthesis C-methylase UbiE
MAYYDHIAKRWHSFTGAEGGAFKKYALNDIMLSRLSGIADQAILEWGAGNGYFMPMVLRRFSGQVPARILITDQSSVLLRIAQRSFSIPEAEYQILDVRATFPFIKESFDLILANMNFSEITTPVMRHALKECHRVLSPRGRLIATLIHSTFVKSLARRSQLRPYKHGVFTMPGSDGLRLPVVTRSLSGYLSALKNAGFGFRSEDFFGTCQVVNEMPGLRQRGKGPIAKFLECEKLRFRPGRDSHAAGSPRIPLLV